MEDSSKLKIETLQGDCLDSLKKLEDQSINTCITSPPYWGLRNYNDEEKQLGMEDTPEEFVENLVKVFREVKRVLHDSGTVWLNLGDSYVGGGRGQWSKEGSIQQVHIGAGVKYGSPTGKINGLKSKDLVGIPWRVAFALQKDGWFLRQDIIWHKPGPMPESVTDRCTKAHEYIFLLSKNAKYYYDHEAIKEDAVAERKSGNKVPQKGTDQPFSETKQGLLKAQQKKYQKRNKRSVWLISTKPFSGAHFATFPKDLIEPCVLAGCPERVCVECGDPYIKKYGRKDNNKNYIQVKGTNTPNISKGGVRLTEKGTTPNFNSPTIKFLGFNKDCKCETEKYESGTVLDPFGGSGTTGIVAAQHNRNAVLLELNKEYIELAKARINMELKLDTLFSNIDLIHKNEKQILISDE